MATRNKKSAVKGRNAKTAKTSKLRPTTSKRTPRPAECPHPGDWLVYDPDRVTLLDFGANLARIRSRLKRKQIALSDCFLSRVPFEPGEPMELGAAELEVY